MENELQIESHAYSIYRPSDGIQLSPSCDIIILNFPFRLAKSRLRGVSILNYYIVLHSKKESDKSGSFFCIARGNQQHFRWKDLQSVH